MATDEKIIWANLLHIYQPPTQFPQVLRKIAEESYFEITNILRTYPRAKLTLNICGSLTEQLQSGGLELLLEQIKELALSGKVELTGSAKYHPLLPKLPKEEMRRQIELNNETNRKVFGPGWNPTGFFAPEMAYSKDVAEIVTQTGFRWMVLSEYAFPPTVDSAPPNTSIYSLKGLPLKVFFRQGPPSIDLAFGKIWSAEDFYRVAKDNVQTSGYLLTAMDGETFGHHRPGLEKVLGEIYRDNRLEPHFISELIDLFPKGLEVEPLPSSWGLEGDELRRGIIYPRWDYPGNSIQARQWQLLNLAIKSVWATSKTDVNYPAVRDLLDRSLHSDQFWWAGARPNWHFRLVEAGAHMMKDVVWQASGASEEDKALATQLHQEIINLGMQLHGDRVIEVK